MRLETPRNNWKEGGKEKKMDYLLHMFSDFYKKWRHMPWCIFRTMFEI